MDNRPGLLSRPVRLFGPTIDASLHRIDAARRASDSAANTFPAALFLCCFAKCPPFLLWTRFPSAPRHDTNHRVKKFGGTNMNETLEAWMPRALSLLRIIAGLLILQHGMAKLIGFPAVPAFANVQPISMLGLAGVLELVGGALL